MCHNGVRFSGLCRTAAATVTSCAANLTLELVSSSPLASEPEASSPDIRDIFLSEPDVELLLETLPLRGCLGVLSPVALEIGSGSGEASTGLGPTSVGVAMGVSNGNHEG